MTATLSSKGNILIVDDTPDNLRLLSAMLIDQGYEVRSVKSGSAAFMVMQAELPDLILLDINMPEMTGYEVCQRLMIDPQTQEIPVIFISALNEAFDKVKAFSIGGVDYISKPFQVIEVLVRVENQLKVRRLQTQLQERNQQLQTAETELRHALEHERTLNQQIEELAAIAERHRIARDIHDSLGHALVALNIQMETALDLWQDNLDEAYRLVQEAKKMGSDALKSVRESVSEIRTDPLPDQSLEQIVAQLVEEFRRITNIPLDCQIHLPHTPSQRTRTAVYRIVQEGLTNINKHAGATAVILRLQAIETGLQITLQDNGRGFQVDTHHRGFGLQGIQERVSALGGELQIVSQPEAGCCITVRLPEG
ncbi:MAG: response regulator [Scytolyngbya sp. HA4215-MV1]|jgi:signal transduction histidine kinase|nr:response regulator [Scytolyngbya sp. HA4215-MV1]